MARICSSVMFKVPTQAVRDCDCSRVYYQYIPFIWLQRVAKISFVIKSAYPILTALYDSEYTNTASLHHPIAGQRPLPTTSTFLDLGPKWTDYVTIGELSQPSKVLGL